MSKLKLFEELAPPDEEGKSRWVSCDEFCGDYIGLSLGNGFSWGRKGSSLRKKYYVKIKRNKNSETGKIEFIKLDGFKEQESNFSQSIRKDIIDYHKNFPCVVSNLRIDIEIDHKDGRKDNERVMNKETQEIEDFQPMNRNINLLKRQKCKKCKETGKRFDAREMGFKVGWIKGKEEYEKEVGCEGCFWFDPITFRSFL